MSESVTVEALRLDRGKLRARLEHDFGDELPGLDASHEGGLPALLAERVGDANDGGAIVGPENTDVQAYGLDDSVVICVQRGISRDGSIRRCGKSPATASNASTWRRATSPAASTSSAPPSRACSTTPPGCCPRCGTCSTASSRGAKRRLLTEGDHEPSKSTPARSYPGARDASSRPGTKDGTHPLE